jgi:hypothetical protein
LSTLQACKRAYVGDQTQEKIALHKHAYKLIQATNQTYSVLGCQRDFNFDRLIANHICYHLYPKKMQSILDLTKIQTSTNIYNIKYMYH